MSSVYLGLGSNQGDSVKIISSTLDAFGTDLLGASSLYQSEPWGYESSHNFVNAVAHIQTALPPFALLRRLNALERAAGRIHTEKYADRLLDIDILFYDDIILRTDALEIPHRHIHSRLFVLIPLCEIAAEHVHPVSKKTIRSLLNECTDENEVKLLNPR